MAEISFPHRLGTTDDFDAVLTGQAPPVPLSSTSGTGGGGVPVESAGPASQVAGGPPGGGMSEFQGLDFSGEGPAHERILSTLTGGQQQVTQDIGGITSDFYTQAGPRRDFEGIGGAGQLESALTTGNLDPARQLVNAQYTGPTGLDETRTQGVFGQLEPLTAAGEAAAQGNLSGLLRYVTPGLTPGEARFDARQYRGDPGFNQPARSVYDDLRASYEALVNEQDAARQFAQGRTEDESAIRGTSRDYLSDAYSDLFGGIASRVDERNQAAADLTQAYQAFQDSGQRQDLQSLPQEALTFDPEDLYTPYRQGRDEALSAYREIMDRYGDVGPLFQLGVNTHGREDLFDPVSGRGDVLHSQAGVRGQLRPEAFQRQMELEALFNPGTGRFGDPARPSSAGRDDANEHGTTGRGEHSVHLPLYFGGEGEEAISPLADLRNYVRLDPGTRATPENTASEDERTRLNRINDLLDVASRLEASNQPFQAASVVAEIDRLLEDEERMLSEREGKLDQATDIWHQQVRDARHRYKDRQDLKRLNDFARAYAFTGSAGLSEIFRPLLGDSKPDDVLAGIAAGN